MRGLNRREMYERNKEHILGYYDSPQDFIDAVDDYREINARQGLSKGSYGTDPGRYVGETMVDYGCFICYTDEARDYLCKTLELDYEDDTSHAWEIYRSMIADDLRKTYVELCKQIKRRR